MTSRTDQDNNSRISKTKAETKAEITDHAAWAIIEDEARSRESKTEKLRSARLAFEAKTSTSRNVADQRANPQDDARSVKVGYGDGAFTT
ncbi:hypothetical protein CSC94_23420 [Zhengella mangrovi]|uniref:Uncharacterized protein n=1 Tax=Zhengella mangrovi TaxID=1982044 RepID=A0A2G1QGG7_9HYPH|nr:hypothetical protein [Zhengella mangrovi]PHP64616.1 hypothetical protein CSC94_23420 [Zhengella mangrovi]